ncbi:chloride channel protein [Novosphingobium sp. BL-8H]|uniref:chloride channel protein n=1 Tax=Novosphingobium sp. BL-8H TaxID=3127640 RepID=UPI003756D8E8
MSPQYLQLRRLRIIFRRHGPEALVWRRRIAIVGGAILIGLIALLFAELADWGNAKFRALYAHWWWAPLLITPLGFAAIVWLTNRFAPVAKGSGIPQVMAATKNPEAALSTLVSLRAAIAKFVLTIGALLIGASVGREGPTVQIAAAVMGRIHKIFRIPLRSSVYIAGGAAGVAAAFNTPLAGVAFAIEELAAAYEQRMTLLVMAAVLIAGMVSLGVAGDYIYFGAMRQTLGLSQAIIATPIAGIVGGLAGGLFSRLMLDAGTIQWQPFARLRDRPLLFAGACGVVVAVLGSFSGLTWGTGYDTANSIISGGSVPAWFGAAKFVSTLATAISGIPGGIFAPSLSIGAGIGDLLRSILPGYPPGAVVLLGMVAYFTGVVRAPLTAVIIISETTASRGLMMPLLAAAVVGEFSAQFICKEKLYHGLSRRFLPAEKPSSV